MIEREDGSKALVVMVAAMSENRVIGRGGDLPWRLPDDLRHFKAATMGHAVIMGRTTFETLPGPLPGRSNIILTSRRSWTAPGVTVAHDLGDALRAAAAMRGRKGVSPESDRVCIAGGGKVYAEALDLADELDLTIVHTVVNDGDAFFPDFDRSAWSRVALDARPADERHAHAFTFERWQRV